MLGQVRALTVIPLSPRVCAPNESPKGSSVSDEGGESIRSARGNRLCTDIL